MSKRTFRASPYLAVAMSLAGAGCGLPPQGSPGGASNTTEQSALVGGTVDSTQYPNVLSVGPTTGQTGCTGTLIAGQWVLTAAHCTYFYNSNSFQVPAAPGMNVYANGGLVGTSQAVYNMSPQLVGSTVSDDSFAGFFNATPTHNGSPDVALIMLTQPIPDPTTNTVTSLVSLATSMPATGASVTTWGEGDTTRPASPYGGPRNFLNWTYSPPTTSSCATYPYDPDCGYANGFYSHNFMNPGDSGGPSFMNGNETIFGVNSRTAAAQDEFGDVEYYRPQLCNLMYNRPHRFCATGAPLGGEPGGCGPFADGTSTNVTTYVVNEDPYCGTTWWDDQCVGEAMAVTSWTDQYTCWSKKGSTYDGYSDIVLAGNFAGNAVPQAVSEGNGTFYGWSHSYDDPAFSGWAGSTGVTALAGDFDGDGFSDVALINRNAASPWSSIPVAFLDAFTDLNMHVTNTAIGGITGEPSYDSNPFSCGGSGGFATWAAACTNAVPVAGDFDGDGKTDIALVGSDYFLTAGTYGGAIPVAFSNGDGSFRVTALPDSDSATYRAGNKGAAAFQNDKMRYSVPVVGDFDGDGRSDIAWVAGEDGTGRAVTNIPIAFSNGDGSFRVVLATVPYSFCQDAAAARLAPIVGDFNGDGLSDIAVVGNSSWTTIPVAFSNGNTKSFGFTFTNNPVASFPAWAGSTGAKAVVGDFNGDGMSDIALTGVSGWTTIPVAFSTGGGNFSVTNSAPDPYSPLDFPAAATTAGATALGGAY